MDIDPIHEGHVLIVPKQHVDSIEKLSDDILTDIMDVARKIVVALKDIYENEGYSIMQNGGKFCDYGHAHFHVFPRYDRMALDGNILKESQSIQREWRRNLGKIVDVKGINWSCKS